MSIGEARRRLRIYRALDNEIRLKAFLAIRRMPGASFNELARTIGIERGLLAYHLAVLKAAGIVEARYGRRSKQTSEYTLTSEGEKLAEELCFKRERRSRRERRRNS
ncbi:MAG: winged helix-turn-helix domain-containing protein [Thermoproteota archaeon]